MSLVNGKDINVDDPENIKYDGKAHQWEPTVTDGSKTLMKDTDYTVTYDKTDFTNVTGEIEVTITGKGNYAGTVTKKYQITPATYTVTTGSDEKVYDGTPLTKTEGAKVEGIVEGETYTFKVTGSQTYVGTSDNTYEMKLDGTAKESNYTHGTDTLGTLKVTAKSLVNGKDINVDDPENIKYDGKAHQWEPTVTDGSKTLMKDTDYTVTYDKTDFTNVTGEIEVTITGKGNYAGTVTKKYQITPATYTVTTGSDEKVYDGTPLTKTEDNGAKVTKES